MKDTKQKIEAWLHDPPHKPYGIAYHAQTTQSNRICFGLDVDQSPDFEHGHDAVAASADRFIFPNPRTKWNGLDLKTDWKNEGHIFIHPFCGSKITPSFAPATRDVAEDWMSSVLKGIVDDSTEADFIKSWRLWMQRLAETDFGGAEIFLPYMVADTRIPDHTIWQHNNLVSALQTCGKKPAFMIFQIGPVQSFIKQARKTIDLWAGSYLLSYLSAHAMEVIIRKYGPDHLIFPQVRGNALIDQLLSDHLGNSLDISDCGMQKRMQNELLLPTLPNRFLALIPAENAEHIMQECKDAVASKWKEICSDVHTLINTEMGDDFPNWDELWEVQRDSFPRCDAIVQKLLTPEKAIRELEKGFPPYKGDIRKHPVLLNKHWAEHCIPEKDTKFLDSRNYEKDDDGRYILNNTGYAWSISYMMAEWKFGALKAARPFEQSAAFGVGSEERQMFEIPKDQLDGELEVLGGTRTWESFWNAVSENKLLGRDGERHFPNGNQRYGLLSVVKRLFAKAHLNKAFDFDGDAHKAIGQQIKSTYEIATGEKCSFDDEEQSISTIPGDKYYAVLCLDGDNMGHWLSGQLVEPLVSHLSGNGIVQFFKDNWTAPAGLDIPSENVPRALTPSYHAAFSEALANFSSYCVRPILEYFQGQLFYAGGDDVLAMVPAANAIDCAEALQMAFRGLSPSDAGTKADAALAAVFDYSWAGSATYPRGFLKLQKSGGGRPSWPMLLPGSKATASVGIAVGHIKAPMQDIIQAARQAEKNAKEFGRDGFNLSIIKRSGESHSFSAHWSPIDKAENNARPDILPVWREVCAKLTDASLSNRFSYAYMQSIKPLLTGVNGQWVKQFDEDSIAACQEFLRIALERQSDNSLQKDAINTLAEKLIQHFSLGENGSISPKAFMNFWMSLAFMARIDTAEGERT